MTPNSIIISWNIYWSRFLPVQFKLCYLCMAMNFTPFIFWTLLSRWGTLLKMQNWLWATWLMEFMMLLPVRYIIHEMQLWGSMFPLLKCRNILTRSLYILLCQYPQDELGPSLRMLSITHPWCLWATTRLSTALLSTRFVLWHSYVLFPVQVCFTYTMFLLWCRVLIFVLANPFLP